MEREKQNMLHWFKVLCTMRSRSHKVFSCHLNEQINNKDPHSEFIYASGLVSQTSEGFKVRGCGETSIYTVGF